MAVLVKVDISTGTPEFYDRVGELIGMPPLPQGAISHAAWGDGDGWHVVDIWESADQFESFVQNTLGPAIGAASQELGIAMSGPPTPEFIELHNAHAIAFDPVSA